MPNDDAVLIRSALNNSMQTWRITLNNDIITLEQVMDTSWDEINRIVTSRNTTLKIQLTLCANVTHIPNEEAGKIYIRTKAFIFDHQNNKQFFLELFEGKLEKYSERSSNFRINYFEFLEFHLIKYNPISFNVGR